MTPDLVLPTATLHSSWLQARNEFGDGMHMVGAGVREQDDVETPAGFAAWIEHLHRCADTSAPPAPGRVHSTNRWVVEDDTYLGAIGYWRTCSPLR